MTVICIAGEAVVDDFLHYGGVFEPFKAYAHTMTFELEIGQLKEEEIVGKILSAFKASAENTGVRVVALFVPAQPEGSWRDKSVKAISNGQNWTMLRDVLELYGWAGDDLSDLPGTLKEKSLDVTKGP